MNISTIQMKEQIFVDLQFRHRQQPSKMAFIECNIDK